MGGPNGYVMNGCRNPARYLPIGVRVGREMGVEPANDPTKIRCITLARTTGHLPLGTLERPSCLASSRATYARGYRAIGGRASAGACRASRTRGARYHGVGCCDPGNARAGDSRITRGTNIRVHDGYRPCGCRPCQNRRTYTRRPAARQPARRDARQRGAGWATLPTYVDALSEWCVTGRVHFASHPISACPCTVSRPYYCPSWRPPHPWPSGWDAGPNARWT